jgi:hypothetical protein
MLATQPTQDCPRQSQSLPHLGERPMRSNDHQR